MDKKILLFGVCFVIAIGLIAQVAIAGNSNGKGKPEKPGSCGNGKCNGKETCENCPEDCCTEPPEPPVCAECICDGDHQLKCMIVWVCEPVPCDCSSDVCGCPLGMVCEPVWSCGCDGIHCEPACEDVDGTYKCACGDCECECNMAGCGILL